MINIELVPLHQFIRLVLLFKMITTWSYLPQAAEAAVPTPAPASNSGNRRSTDSFSKVYKYNTNCLATSHGCSLLLPKDVYYNPEINAALSVLRGETTNTEEDRDDSIDQSSSAMPLKEERHLMERQQALEDLKTQGVWNEDGVTMTLIGYKGGKMEDQINQDRSFVLSPYNLSWFYESNDKNDHYYPSEHPSQIMGVMDGHGNMGEIVSEYSVHQLYHRLSNILQDRLIDDKENSNPTTDVIKENQVIRDSITQVFLDINATIPTQGQGGCTASIAFRYKDHVHFANVGDSRAFLVAYHPPTEQFEIVYETMEHKPHLKGEKERILSMGGQVQEPTPKEMEMGASSRLVTPYVSLAMSRSLGDWECSRYGNIALPDVHTIPLNDILEQSVQNMCPWGKGEDIEEGAAQEKGEQGTCPSKDSIRIFVVAATDGLLDFVPPQDLVATLARSLYASTSDERTTTHPIHPTTACEKLIMQAAEGWYQDMGYDYRDDIAVAAMKII